MSWRIRSNGMASTVEGMRSRSISPRSWGSLVDDSDTREPLGVYDLVTDLGGGKAGVGQQTREGGGRGDGEEAGEGFAHGRQLGEQVAAQGAGVGDRDRVGVPIVLDRGEYELVLVGPTAVEHGLAGGRRCGAPTSVSPTAIARVTCSSPATRRTSTHPPAARG